MSAPDGPASGRRRVDERHVLAVDLGTGGPKVGLVSMAGHVVWQEHTRLPTRYLPGGGAVQDPHEWWRAISWSAKRALSSGLVDPAQVEAVCCTGQWGSTVPVGPDGEPVGDCVLWMDERGGRLSAQVIGGPVAGYDPRKLAAFVRKSGGVPSPQGRDPLAEILTLRHEHPEVYRAAAVLLEPIDYLGLLFSGRVLATPATMTASWLTDNRRGAPLGYDPELVRLSTRDPATLPPLVATGSVIGPVRRDVAAELGLDERTVVVAGAPDLHTATLGSGAVGDFEAHLAISTTSWISCHVPFKRTDALRSVASVPGVVRGRWLVANNHETAGLCFEWLQRQVIAPDDGLVPGTAEPSLHELDELAASAPPGSGGVIFTPWLAGERSPVNDDTVRGSFHNLGLRTGRAHLVRAVLEGVAYNDRWLLGAVERFCGERLDPIRLVGGGARSELWCQIHADVLNRRVEQVADPLLANLRGAALLAAMALGAVAPSELRDLVPVAATYAPDRRTRATYDALFSEFPRLYKAQRKMYARLNRRRGART